jgi:hypothetical protein
VSNWTEVGCDGGCGRRVAADRAAVKAGALALCTACHPGPLPVVTMGCETCIVVGHCPRCGQVVCFGHHLDVEAQVALPGEELRERMRPDPMFAKRCPEAER